MNDFLRDLVRETLQNPRAAARRLIGLQLDPASVWAAFGAVVALSAGLGWLSIAATPVATAGVVPAAEVTPLSIAGVQAGSLLTLAILASFGGRIFGGQGTFLEALTLAVWLEFLLILLQIVQLLVMVIFPFSSVLIGLLGMVVFLWLLTNFVAELHGFQSLGKTFLGVILGFFLAGMVAMMILGPNLAQQGM